MRRERVIYITIQSRVLCTTSDPNPFETRENMTRCSRRNISMVIYALQGISVIPILSDILESPEEDFWRTEGATVLFI
jgi:hypothetical protein